MALHTAPAPTFSIRVMEDGSVEADPDGPGFGAAEFDRMATAVAAVCTAEGADAAA